MLLKLTFLLLVLILIGFVATILLFKGDWQKIKEKELDKKIVMWFPFALLFITIFYIGYFAKITFLLALLYGSLREFYKNRVFLINKISPLIYALLFTIGLLHISLYNIFFQNSSLLTMIIFISVVLADVFAFFMGTFSKHKLPEVINSSKSYAGVLGQIVGSIVGVFILEKYITGVIVDNILILILPIAFGAIVGDLYNSYIKRTLNIKDWSKLIPGHGGIIDRFCSVVFAILFTFYSLLIFN